jgi:hypothetical protein
MYELIISAILALFPYMSGNNRACIEQRATQIAAALSEAHASYPQIPSDLLASIAFHETHFGCDRGEGGNWGAPISRFRRHTAGTHMHAAAALAASLRICGTLEGAINRFRVGLCTPNTRTRRQADRYRRRVLALQQRIRQYIEKRGR